MSGDWDDDLCKSVLVVVEKLCFNSLSGYSQNEVCKQISYVIGGRKGNLNTGN